MVLTNKARARVPGEHFGLRVEKTLLTTPGRANYSYPTYFANGESVPYSCTRLFSEFESDEISK